MTRKAYIRIPATALAVIILSLAAFSIHAQTAARFLGSVTAINGNTLTVKTDAGEEHQVAVPDSAVLKRVEPGQKDLSSAAPIAFSDLAVGDRVLVRLDANASTPTAQQIIAIKAADVKQKQQQELVEWQRNGIAGLVKSIDTTNGVITVGTGAGPTARTVTVKTTPATVLKRYAPDSVSFDKAQPGPISAIQAGDQLRAKGDKSADGTQVTADTVVSGTFKNLSGTIASIDAGASTVSIKDLATKKNFTIHIGPDSQMHRIPDQMAQGIAARLKGTSSASGAQAPARTQSQSQAPGATSRGANGDSSQLLNRTPVIQLSDLQKGQAIMVVASNGSGNDSVDAIMLLAGVEPLLEAPAARDLLSSWSMGGGDGGGGAQ